MNNKDALDNIRRKAPAPRKPNQPSADDMLIPSQQMDMVSGQLMATQAQLHAVEGRYNELSIHHSMLLQEVIGLQKTVVNHEHVMQQIMTFLHGVDATQRRNSKLVFPGGGQSQNGTSEAPNQAAADDDDPASPLQHASKLLSETNADVMLNPRNLEHMNEITMRMNGTLTTPPPDILRAATRPTSRGPPSASSTGSMRLENLDNLVYPVGSSNGIDPMYSEHINNIPYAAPPKAVDASEPKFQEGVRKKSAIPDPGWIRAPQILLVEDDPTCRRIGSKFLYAFHCHIDSAVSMHLLVHTCVLTFLQLDGLEAVNKMNAGSKYDLVLMDIIMPNLDGVSACHLIRQFDTTPIVAMTSNIRSDDISMYFQHGKSFLYFIDDMETNRAGMNDVLPKPFTKEGLLHMLEKHLVHLKKPLAQIEGMAAPQPVQVPRQLVLKEEDSPAKSPATTSNWNSPNQVPGVSPVGNNVTDEYAQAIHNQQVQHPGPYAVNPMQAGIGYNGSPQMPMQARQQQPLPPGHRRQISEISGGDDMTNPTKRQQIYPPQMQQPMNPMQPRPR